MSIYSCSEDSSRETSAPAAIPQNQQDANPANNPSNASNGIKPTQTAAQCNQQGLAWKAVLSPGDDPTGCQGQLAPFGCCLEVIAQIWNDQDLISQVSSRVNQKTGQGLKLYNCEQISNNHFKFHFGNATGPGVMQYGSVGGEGMAKPLNAIQVSCPQVPDTSFLDIGLQSPPQNNQTPQDTSTNTGTSLETQTETSTDTATDTATDTNTNSGNEP